MPLNIVLIGFMGSGKSTIGHTISNQSHFTWIDTDHLISQKAGLSISNLFAKVGEPSFRALEKDICDGLKTRKDYVISTGGGIILSEKNRAILRNLGQVIWLDTPIKVILSHLAGELETRPLATSKEALETLYVERKTLYKKCCHIQVQTANKSPAEISFDILKHFK